jgi:hypothetical protein
MTASNLDSDSRIGKDLAERESELERLRAEVRAWRERVGRQPVRGDADFTTVSARAL